MKLRNKLVVLVLVPIQGMIIIFFSEVILYLNTISNMENLNQLQTEIQKILNADRDAYQALLAEITASQFEDVDQVSEQIKRYKENSNQFWERISEPVKNFTAEMLPNHSKFVGLF